MTTLAGYTRFTLIFIALAFTTLAQAAEPVSKSRFKGVAIGGHDTVAYHTLTREPQANALKGQGAFVVSYKGAKWRFADKATADKFAADPDQYSPAYNGHCANALSLGEGLVRTDGTHWEIFDDKLFLFYAAKGRTRWNDGSWKSYKVDADAAWARLSK